MSSYAPCHPQWQMQLKSMGSRNRQEWACNDQKRQRREEMKERRKDKAFLNVDDKLSNCKICYGVQCAWLVCQK